MGKNLMTLAQCLSCFNQNALITVSQKAFKAVDGLGKCC